MKKPVLLTILTALILTASTALIALVANAEKLDLETHNNLIQKLESAIKVNKADTMMSQPALAHRLADLYAERARLLSLENEGQGDKTHRKEIETDRKNALSIYKNILRTLDKQDKGIVLMQMAHLNNLENSPEEAQSIYQKIVTHSEDFNPAIVALAHIQRGDIQFLKGEFTKAQISFQDALNISQNPRMAYTKFRLAWVHYNLGFTKLAEKEVITLLKQPKLFINKSGVMDLSFHEEVSHDLGTFMAKNDINPDSIETLSKLSPESARQKNLIYLANELDRTAKKNSALKVWAVIGTHEMNHDDRLERQIQVTRIQYDLGHKTELLTEIDRSIALLKDPACSNSQECLVGNQNLRKIITDWGKAEERVPSTELVLAYQKYTSQFEDFEMTYWAAHAATQRKMYPQAFDFYKSSAHLAQTQKTQNKNPEHVAKIFEGSLLGAIEVAELSKDRKLRLESYQLYLEMNSNGARATEVRYQIAHWSYEGNDYAKASDQFLILALDPRMTEDLRVKSADLCLDSDVLLKNEGLIEAHSLELSTAIKSKSSEYAAIWRKSILNQSAKIINSEAAGAPLDTELKKINSIHLAGWPVNQRKMMIQNKILISLRQKNMEELAKASSEMLDEPSLSVAEKNEALRHLAWVSELKLNFADAIKYLSQVTPGQAELPEFMFKLATLKELSHQDPTLEFTRFISLSRDSLKRQYAAHQLVLASPKPKQQFSKFESLLSGNAALYASAGVFLFEKTKDSQFANKLLARSAVRNSDLGKLLVHSLALKEFSADQAQIGRLKFKTQTHGQSDSQLKKSLNARIRSLKHLESKSNQFIAKKDTTLQLVYLAQLSIENTRLANEILALPLPKGLKVPEQPKYRAQVQLMVQPYIQQADRIQKKTQELWMQAMARSLFKNLFELSEQQKPGSQLAAHEIGLLRQSAHEIGLANDPFRIFSDQRQKVSSEMEDLRNKVKDNPFDSSYLEKMKKSQKSLGGGPMLAYLDGRLTELEKARGVIQ